MNKSEHILNAKVSLLAALIGASACISQEVLATPYSYYYMKDAQTHNNTGSGTTDPNIFFSTPIVGVQALSFTQANETVGSAAFGASASTTYSAGIAPGRLSSSSDSTVTGTFGGAIGTGLSSSAQQVLRFRDTITPTGGTIGDAVNLTLTLDLNAVFSSFNLLPAVQANPALCGYGQISLYANANFNRVASLAENLCLGSQTQTVSATFGAVIGTSFDFELGMDMFTQSAIGAGNLLGSSVSIDASHTGEAFLAAPTNIQLVTASGATYRNTGGPNGVPEPSTLALSTLGMLGLLANGRRRRDRIN